jgi:hypothetical protein
MSRMTISSRTAAASTPGPSCRDLQLLQRNDDRTVWLGDDLESYVRGRLGALDTTQRLRLGLLDNDVTPLLIGVRWGIELVSSSALRLFWLFIPDKGIGRKRYLVEIIGEGHARKSYKTGLLVPKVLTRTYRASSRRWTPPLLKPAAWFTHVASMEDPLVREALRYRSMYL